MRRMRRAKPHAKAHCTLLFHQTRSTSFFANWLCRVINGDNSMVVRRPSRTTTIPLTIV